MIDYTRLLKKINQDPGGEDVLRLRVGVVVSVATSTATVTISGVSVSGVPMLAGAAEIDRAITWLEKNGVNVEPVEIGIIAG